MAQNLCKTIRVIKPESENDSKVYILFKMFKMGFVVQSLSRV